MDESDLKYDRFTDPAKRALHLSNQVACQFNQEEIGTEYILLGLIKAGPKLAMFVLNQLAADAHRIQMELTKHLPSKKITAPTRKLPQTSEARKVIEYAVDEARQLEHDYIGTEHLLLGLIHDRLGVAGQILKDQGLTLEAVRAEIRSVLNQSKPPENQD